MHAVGFEIRVQTQILCLPPQNAPSEFMKILAILIRLRQACISQDLLPSYLQVNELFNGPTEEEKSAQSSADEQKLAEASTWLSQRGPQVQSYIQTAFDNNELSPEAYECPICWDVADNASLLPCGHGCCTAHITDLNDCKLRGASTPQRQNAKCLNCVVNCVGPLCRSTDMEPTVELKSVFLSLGGKAAEELLKFSDQEQQQLRDIVVGLRPVESNNSAQPTTASNDSVPPPSSDAAAAASATPAATTSTSTSKAKSAANSATPTSATPLTVTAAESSATLPAFSINSFYSTKFAKATEILQNTREVGQPCSKAIVFCMFTSALKYLGEYIDTTCKREQEKIKVCGNECLDRACHRLMVVVSTAMLTAMLMKILMQVFFYNGTMAVADRDETLIQFEAYTKSGGVAVLLVSTTCGNAGLNLTCAHTCIFLDIWYAFAVMTTCRLCHFN